MTAIQLRTEVKKRLDKTSDLGFLEELKQLLLRPDADRAAFVEMNRMTDLSDEAIRKGDVFTNAEVIKHLHHRGKRK
jgi:RNA polymerase-interacting CarD/CdnL/TRCF family regulator